MEGGARGGSRGGGGGRGVRSSSFWVTAKRPKEGGKLQVCSPMHQALVHGDGRGQDDGRIQGGGRGQGSDSSQHMIKNTFQYICKFLHVCHKSCPDCAASSIWKECFCWSKSNTNSFLLFSIFFFTQYVLGFCYLLVHTLWLSL